MSFCIFVFQSATFFNIEKLFGSLAYSIIYCSGFGKSCSMFVSFISNEFISDEFISDLFEFMITFITIFIKLFKN